MTVDRDGDIEELTVAQETGLRTWRGLHHADLLWPRLERGSPDSRPSRRHGQWAGPVLRCAPFTGVKKWLVVE